MREFVLIVVFISGGVVLLGIYSFLEFSRGVTKSEVERANTIVNAVKYNGAQPNLTYWVNVYYLRLIGNFKFVLGISMAVFFIAFVTLSFL